MLSIVIFWALLFALNIALFRALSLAKALFVVPKKALPFRTFGSSEPYSTNKQIVGRNARMDLNVGELTSKESLVKPLFLKLSSVKNHLQ